MIKTGFSFGTAVGKLAEVASRLVELGWTEGPIADRNSTFGHVRWRKACKEAGLRPVFGVELGVTKDKTVSKPVVDYWTFLPTKNMRPLNDLIYQATSSGREPLLSYEEANNASELIKIAGERTDVELTDWRWVLLGLSPATPVSLYRKARSMGAVSVAVPRNVYPRESDLEFYRVALGFRSGTQTYPQHIVSDKELIKSVAWFAKDSDLVEAIIMRQRILGSSTAELTRAELLKPARLASLEDMCVVGAIKLGVDLNDTIYKERLERELELIEQKSFSDYFYLLTEMVNWAKERMVVGPARGSSCGSLVCYLLGITAIDPLKHGLLFERFIDVTRADLPDVDLDFSEAHRDEVFAHIESLYPGKVARLGNINTFGVKSALNQIGASLSVPSHIVDAVAETAIKRAMGDSRKSSTMEDTLNETESGKRMIAEYPETLIVARLEGHPHNPSKHAAGMVATSSEILDYVAVDARTGGTMCDKYDAEELNLLKVDVLGLTQLTVFERAMELIGVDPVSGWHEKLPLDDPAAFEVLNQRRFCGVFQFEGAAMRGLSKQIQFESLDDIVAATALVRPGPMASGNTEKWVARRAGRERASYAHALLEPYLGETFGIPCYQEQVLQIGREVGDLTWADVTALRKAMSKSLGKEYFAQFGDKFVVGATERGMPAEVAASFFDDMTNFGAWAFNKSHSVAYAYVSYWSAWWKAHYPVEYACACLDMQADPAKQIELLKELREEGIDYVAVDVAHSGESWLPLERDGRKYVLGPLSNVVGVGPSKRRMILECRKNGTLLPNGLARMMANPRTLIDSLEPIQQWVRKTYPGNALVTEKNIVSRPTQVATIEPDHGDVLAIVVPARIMPKDENEPVKVAKRGYKVTPSASLVVFLRDDSGEILGKVGPKQFEGPGKEMLERGKAGKAVYAIRGRVGMHRMIWIDRVRYLGDLT
jgi:DNA polymerase III alpha subunit